MRATEFVTEIEKMDQSQYRGGKDTLDSYSTPGKKHLRALPGGSDLMYSITSDAYSSYVHIVDPGIPGITKPSIVASLSLVKGVIPDSVQVGAITVDEDYRGRGLAKALYGIVLTIMKKTLISGSSQTPGGRRNWLSLASIPGVEIKGLLDLANFQIEKSRQVDNTIDQLMQLGGQFVARDNNYTYWAFDVVPGNGQLAPAVKNKLSKLYGYDSTNLLMATWTGGQQAVAEGYEQDYLNQISELLWKPVSRSIWNTIQDEGLDEEQDAPDHTNWVMASLSIDPKDAQALQVFDSDAIEDFNRFDIHLKSRYPGLTDLIDYDRGTVTIVKPINTEGLAENFADGRNPQDKGDSQRHGIPKNATMAELEKASHAAGRKGQLARWQLNMRRGHKK